MDQIQTAIDFIKRLEPDLQGFVRFVTETVVPGGGREIGALAVRNFLKIFDRCCRVYEERRGRGLTAEELNRIPIDAGVEFLRVASFVSEDEMQQVWASLLSSFAEDPGRYAKVKFISILHNLDGLDTVVFKRIYEASIPEPSDQYATSLVTEDLPVAAHFRHGIENPRAAERRDPSPAVQVSLENLERLSLIRPDLVWTGPAYSAVFRTRLGSEFAKAVLVEEPT